MEIDRKGEGGRGWSGDRHGGVGWEGERVEIDRRGEGVEWG